MNLADKEKEFCCYCGKCIVYPLKRTSEHIIPVSIGGSNNLKNKRPCCHKCNGWRGNKSLEYWKAEVLEIIRGKKLGHTYSFRKTWFMFTVYDLEIIIINIEHIQQAIRTATPDMWKAAVPFNKRHDYITINSLQP